MPRRIDDVEADALDIELVAVGQPHRNDISLRILTHHGDAAGAVAEGPKAGDVIRVKVDVDCLDQAEVELVYELEISVDLLEDGGR